ncbi:MAG: hypothetical protein ACK5YC_16770 [Planctomyces sp.]|jgi:hypothetical protein
MSIVIPSILLMLTGFGAVIFLVLLVGYCGLLLVRYVLRSLQHGAAPPVFVARSVPASVQSSPPFPQTGATAVAGPGSWLRSAFLTVLGLAVGTALSLMLSFSARQVQVPQQQAQPTVDGAFLTQPQPELIPLQADPVPVDSVEPVAEADLKAPQPPESARPQLLEVASQLGQFFQSQLQQTADTGAGQVQLKDGGEAAAGAAGESANGDVVVYQFSEQMLADLFGVEAIDTLRSISQQMPPGIRNSYALIPLPGSVGATVPPMKPLLASSGLRSLADSLVQLLKAGPANGQQATELPGKSLPAEQPEIPAWVRQPSAGHRVARAEVLPGEDTEDKVRESVEELLQQELQTGSEWIPVQLRQSALLASVGVSAGSLRTLVHNRFERQETLEQPIDGANELQVIWTEIELPRAEILGQLSLAAGQHRSWLLAAGVLIFWLGLVLAAISSRLWASGGLLSRVVSFGSGVFSIALLVAVVLVLLQTARGLPLEGGQLFNGAVVWSGLGGDVRVSL